MHFNSEHPKYYRFPNQKSIIDFEMDYSIYFPAKETSSHREMNLYKEENSACNVRNAQTQQTIFY